MDLNVNKLPETNDSRLKPDAVERAVQPEPRDKSRMVKAAGFLVVVGILTALAVSSHTSGPATMASDTPPPVASTTMPAATAPTDRATTGSAVTMPPTMAPSAPGEPTATGAQPDVK